MEKVIGFVDESGAFGFDFTNSNTHFVITVLLIEESKLNNLENSFLQIKNKYYPISELKSSNIGNKEDLRLKILREITPLSFNYFSVVIDKTKIYKDSGLQYKRSFYKFLYGLLYNNLYQTFLKLEIVADQIGSPEFMQGFINYVNENYKVDLFHQEKFNFSESHNTLLLQLSDLLAGTINRYYSGRSRLILNEILPGKNVGNIYWPSSSIQTTPDETEIEDEYKNVIKDVSLLRVDNYLAKNKGAVNETELMRIRFLEYLKSIYIYNQKTRYVATHEILEHLRGFTTTDLSEQFLRSQVVGPLRDEDVIISSSNAGGYKIPYLRKDLLDFVDLCNTRIKPLANRLKKCNDAFNLATGGKLDLLSGAEYEILKNITKE